MDRTGHPTLQDVSRHAGVSTATVSRCVNDPEKVARKTRERIERAIEELGYTPNFGGRVLASRRSNTIGVVIPTMNNAMFAGALQAVQEVLSDSGKSMLVATSGYDPEQEFRQIRALVGSGADGLLLIGTDRPATTRDYLARRAVPHVLTWCHDPTSEAPTVGFDNHEAGKVIAEAAIGLGHRALGIIGGISTDNDRAAGRIEGMRAAVAEAAGGVRIVGVQETRYSLDRGGEAFDRLMARDPIPSVILCGNDVLATGAILRARARGMRVPEDVSITGIDDHDLARVVLPALTTVRVPQRDMGRQAAQVLLERISGVGPVRGRELPLELVWRDSLAAPCQVPPD